MNKNQVQGAVKNAAGKVQAKVGEVIGNPKQQVKGAAKQMEGTLQKGVGDAQEAVKDSAKKSGNKS